MIYSLLFVCLCMENKLKAEMLQFFLRIFYLSETEARKITLVCCVVSSRSKVTRVSLGKCDPWRLLDHLVRQDTWSHREPPSQLFKSTFAKERFSAYFPHSRNHRYFISKSTLQESCHLPLTNVKLTELEKKWKSNTVKLCQKCL